MTFQVRLDITEEQILQLADKAPAFGFLRINPQPRWTLSEQKEAARFVMQKFSR